MATIVDTSLYKLNKNAFAILSGAYHKMPEIASAAIDAYGSDKQPKLEAQLIQVGALADQISEHVILNANGTAIIGIKNEDVSVINALLMCLREVAELGSMNGIPSPLLPPDTNDTCCSRYDVGPVGSILVSSGIDYIPVTPTAIGQVPVWDGTTVIWTDITAGGIPAGGLTGQFLRKLSNTSYDAGWQTLTIAMVTDITSNAAELNALDGLNVGAIGAAQFNTLVGINTAQTIQQQFDGKMSNALTDGHFFVGNASDIATDVAPTGDVIFNNAGVFAIQPNVIVDDDISTTAEITRSKIKLGSAWRVLINGPDGHMAEANGIIPDRALISNAEGIPIASVTDATRLGYISTLSSNAQDQLNVRLTVNLTTPVQGDTLHFNGTEWVNLAIGAAGTVLTSDGNDVLWGPVTGNGLPTGGTTGDFLRKIDGTDFNAGWFALLFEDITDVSTTAAEINLLSGLTVGSALINLLDGASANIQDQIDNRLMNSLGHNAIFVGNASNIPVQLATGPDGYVLTSVGGAPQWVQPSPPGNVSGVAPSTDNAIVRWNGVGADSIQNSGVIINDTNDVTGVASLSTGQVVVLNNAAVRFYNTGSTNYTAITSHTSTAINYTIVLPALAPTANTFLKYDGADYVWDSAASAFIDLTDVPNDYTGFGGYGVAVKATEDGLEFVALGGSGTVTSISGTPNRISITGTPSVNPTIDIDVAYAGQASITTLGTIGTGTWNATNISLAKGGTGASLSDPGADRIMFWDESANAVTWLEVGSGLTITGTVITGTGSYTNEMAQDAVGGILANTATITFTYVDEPTPSISANVNTNSITGALFRQSAALSVVGNPTNATANVTDIAAASDFQVLRRSGTSIGFGAINLASSSAVTNVLPITNGGTGGTSYTFLSLTDTPDAYTGHALEFVQVKSDESGLQFVPYVIPPYFLAKEVPAGVVDGMNTTFTLSFTPSPGSETVYLNGQLLEAGIGNDYTISGAVITMADPPQVIDGTPDKIIVVFGGSTGWVGLTDGNKGDITVSGTGTSWVINNTAVTYAKIQNVTQDRILGRISTGAGTVEELTGTQTATLLPTFTTTAKGLVPFPTTVTGRFLRDDGSWQLTGGGGGFPPDGNYGDIAVTSSGTVWTVRPETITYSKIQNGTALSVLGVTGGVTADLADIVAGTDGHVLRRSGTSLAFGTISSTGIANAAVTYAKIQNATALSVLGNAANALGTPADIVATTDAFVLRRSGTSLGFGQVQTGGIANNAVSFAKMQAINTARFVGRTTSGVGDPEELNAAQATALLDVFAPATKGLVPSPGTATGKFLRDDSTWQTISGGGFTNTAAINELIKAGSSTTGIPSGFFTTSAGNLIMGEAGASGGSTRTFTAEGSGTIIGFSFVPKGTGPFSVQISGNINLSGGNAATLTAGQVLIGSSTAAADVVIVGSAASTTQAIRTSPGDSSNNNGKNFSLLAGSAYGSSGNGNGGTLTIASGTGFGAGVSGNIVIDSKLGNASLKSYDFTIGNNANSRYLKINTTDVGAVVELLTSGAGLKLETPSGQAMNFISGSAMTITTISGAITMTAQAGLSMGATTGNVGIRSNAAESELRAATNLRLTSDTGNVFMSGLRTTAGASGTLWRDPADSNRVKYVP